MQSDWFPVSKEPMRLLLKQEYNYSNKNDNETVFRMLRIFTGETHTRIKHKCLRKV